MSLMLEEKVKAPWKWVSKFKGQPLMVVPTEELECENPPVIEPKGLSAKFETAGVLHVPDTMKPITYPSDWTSISVMPCAGFTMVEEEKETINVGTQYMATFMPTMWAEEFKAQAPHTYTPGGLAAKFILALRQVIAEAGVSYICETRAYTDHPDLKGMRYIYENKGDCIIGRTLVKMGHAPEVIRQYEGTGAAAVIKALYGDDPHSVEVMRLASYAQTVNDSRQPWGLALSIGA